VLGSAMGMVVCRTRRVEEIIFGLIRLGCDRLSLVSSCSTRVFDVGLWPSPGDRAGGGARGRSCAWCAARTLDKFESVCV
jgi:hypothetical protein